ncbi:hypothetical protein KQ51_01416 [Candidatus Izimaplasma bacterium HR1]|jgi:hypothetical protein|nr:hypothetical protein KQ51_01416 [Candidatus Izimaplasma bacterium HR1]
MIDIDFRLIRGNYMVIKNEFSVLGLIRRYKVLIDNVHVSDLKRFKSLDMEHPNHKFYIQFKISDIATSVKYIVDDSRVSHLKVGINPLVRLYSVLFLVLSILSIFTNFKIEYLYLYPILFFFIFLFYIVFQGS